ncbi:MAG TPA: cell division protein ZipA C-terminal FtsZ-binding domain-containing protein [Thauera sp.]|uniref:cell division protein ZipA C-terminal FtsZ-binding domain-containing protein n=1 Tax=Thauera sp. TaxID=1905334 RepID=UPI001D7A7DE6|nr:cell division protein ZipA C-terminal FtsZ-binding domain-containing protein [Thauera sp.]MCB1944758.1 cell division protein ZipA C-terminal FtsZ-binding domain-containing protein [Thauera sp.]MCP5223656.1 cell division protein ZipA C-terminal FtsZ-binding domain-containing protein [Thauera sp.]HPE04038.1 cell division protein ZipA C-terminal FtsZ-binding domain-containing protein [Thauera sp.]HRV77643.1 cell division protein ZipA C-terminal FtsZ-binding domain-containing protein [Thauera sp
MDSELQIALIGAGIAAVVLVVGYNKWQERRHRREAERAFKSEHRDVLLEPREEPVAGERREPGIGAAEGEPRRFNEAPMKRSTPELPRLLDPRADCVIRLETIEALEVGRVWAIQAEQLAGLAKPVYWFGFNDAENVWQPLGPDSGGACHWFCAALQLVNREGSIGETDFMRFSGGVQRVADALMSLPPALPPRAETLRNATELDRFCADVDVQIGVNVVARDGQFEGRAIHAVAEKHGLRLGADGAYHMVDGEHSVFAVANLESGRFSPESLKGLVTRGLTLVIDVPRVANGGAAFDRMMKMATTLAGELGGDVVDDNRAPFGAEAAAIIRGQIGQFQSRMADHDIPAGSPLALRLFSV